jgi:hypothetical protein
MWTVISRLHWPIMTCPVQITEPNTVSSDLSLKKLMIINLSSFWKTFQILLLQLNHVPTSAKRMTALLLACCRTQGLCLAQIFQIPALFGQNCQSMKATTDQGRRIDAG